MASERSTFIRLLARANDQPEPGLRRVGPTPVFPEDMVARARRESDRTSVKREPQIVTQTVNQHPFPGGKSVKGRQAWKYPGGNIRRAPGLSLNGRYYSDPKEDDSHPELQAQSGNEHITEGTPRRKQESNFFITINPNQKYVNPANKEVAQKAFTKALEHLERNETLARMLKFGPKDKHYISDVAHDVILPGIDWKATVEEGEKLGRMHAHIILYIQHYSQIQIDPKMLQYEFKQGFNAALGLNFQALALTDPPYVQIKMLPQTDWTTIMRQYIRKGMESA